MSVTACSTGSFDSSEHSSPDRPVATRSRAVMPLFSRKPFSRIQSSLNIFAEIPRAMVVKDDHDHVVRHGNDRGAGAGPAIADPAELPAKMPSSRAIRRVMIAASLSVTFSK